MTSESPLGDEAQATEAAEVPDLVDEPDNDPDETEGYIDVEVQDREGAERPEVDKHPED
jgi:hypothetical protein